MRGPGAAETDIVELGICMELKVRTLARHSMHRLEPGRRQLLADYRSVLSTRRLSQQLQRSGTDGHWFGQLFTYLAQSSVPTVHVAMLLGRLDDSTEVHKPATGLRTVQVGEGRGKDQSHDFAVSPGPFLATHHELGEHWCSKCTAFSAIVNIQIDRLPYNINWVWE